MTNRALREYDEVGRYETPSKFDYDGLMQKVIKLKVELEELFNVDFQIDDQVQDASFLCDLRIPKELIPELDPSLEYSIRISNFGQLATINFQAELGESTLKRMLESLEKHDFEFISTDELDSIYDGQFEEFKKIGGDRGSTWYMRYFDYL